MKRARSKPLLGSSLMYRPPRVTVRDMRSSLRSPTRNAALRASEGSTRANSSAKASGLNGGAPTVISLVQLVTRFFTDGAMLNRLAPEKVQMEAARLEAEGPK
jgi:hypothetical protein